MKCEGINKNNHFFHLIISIILFTSLSFIFKGKIKTLKKEFQSRQEIRKRWEDFSFVFFTLHW